MVNNKAVQQGAYRSIFRSTSLFGGVQAYEILIRIVQSKFIAILLGPLGVGIQGLFSSGIDVVRQLTSFGLAQSAVKDISEANATGDNHQVARTSTVLKKLVWITGLLGLLCAIIFSPLLSKYAFGNHDYTIPFMFLSSTLFIDQLCSGQKVLLQGLRKLKDLAKASAIGSTVSLLVSVPLYYLFGVRGIVPTLILNSLATFLLALFFSRKIHLEKVTISIDDVFKEGKSMLKMGIALSISSILISLCSFVLRGYIRGCGGEEEVGLFAAGFAIINTYVSMIFTAMGTDYYPRLAAISDDNKSCKVMVNQQAEIGVLILSPLLAICIIFMPLVIYILYSNKFAGANEYVSWAALGMMLKMASWCIAYQFVAKGESRVFIINEVSQNAYTLCLNILGYHLFGLEGLGISFVLCQGLYLIQVYIVAHIRYGFSFNVSFYRYYAVQFLILILAFAECKLWPAPLSYAIGIFFIAGSLAISYKGLNERLDIFSIIKRKK